MLWWAAGPIAPLDINAMTPRDITARTWDMTTDERNDSPSGAQGVSGNSTGDAPGGFVEQRGARRVVLVSGKDSMTRRLQLPAGTPASAGVMDLAVSTAGSDSRRCSNLSTARSTMLSCPCSSVRSEAM